MGEVIVDPEGQRQDVGQVGHCQVNHEDHRLGVLAVEIQGGGNKVVILTSPLIFGTSTSVRVAVSTSFTAEKCV